MKQRYKKSRQKMPQKKMSTEEWIRHAKKVEAMLYRWQVNNYLEDHRKTIVTVDFRNQKLIYTKEEINE